MDIRPQSRVGRGTVQLVDLLEFAVEQANDGIAIMKFTGNADVPVHIVYANEAIERLSGYSRAELLDPSNPFLRVQPQNRERYDELFAEVRAGNPVHFEIELGGKNKKTWTDIRWSPLRYKDGEVTHYVAVLRDLSDRRRARSERELLYRAIEQAHDGIVIMEVPQGDLQLRRVTYVNDAICKLLKFSREDLVGCGELSRSIFALSPELRQEALSIIGKGGVFEHDVHARCGDGSMRWLHTTAKPVYDESGAIGQITITYADIDEAKKRGDQIALFQSIFSQTSDFIVTTDAKRPSEGGPFITSANPSFAAIAGLEPFDLMGRPLMECFSERNDPAVIAGVCTRLERHQNISVELQVQRPLGQSDLWIELTGNLVRGENARAASWFFIGKDISMRKQGYMQTAQLMTALDLAEEPIAIYAVVGPLQLELQHMNESAAAAGVRVLERMLGDPHQRGRIQNIWTALEEGKSAVRLVRTGENEARQWVTLELRPLNAARGRLSSIVAIEYPVERSLYSDHPDEMATMLALSREILSYDDMEARRDAFVEVLREEMGASALFSRTARTTDVLLRVKENAGYVVMPAGVFFERTTAVALSWSRTIPPRRLTAFRILLETLARSD